MSKRFFSNFLLAFGVFTLVLLSCDRRTDNEKWQAEIQYFIMTQADDFKSYKSLSFQQIDLNFLMAQSKIQTALTVLQDTTRTKLKFLKLLAEPLAIETQLRQKTNDFPVDQVDDFLLENAQLDQLLKSHFTDLPEEVLSAQNEQKRALSQINDQLATYGMSIYSINLTDGNVVFYYHTFQLQGNKHSGVFELDKESMSILSFKELTSA